MINSPKTCGKHETLQTVSRQMSKSNIGTLPVVDENKKVIGIITDRDICLAVGKRNRQPISELKVQDVMTPRVHTCRPEDNVSAALKIMRTKHVSRVPVVDSEQRLKGIVTLKNIVRDTYESKDAGDIEFMGDENVIKTIYSLANKNSLETIVM